MHNRWFILIGTDEFQFAPWIVGIERLLLVYTGSRMDLHFEAKTLDASSNMKIGRRHPVLTIVMQKNHHVVTTSHDAKDRQNW